MSHDWTQVRQTAQGGAVSNGTRIAQGMHRWQLLIGTNPQLLSAAFASGFGRCTETPCILRCL